MAGLNLGYVACIESGHIEQQALLLFESIRALAGPFGRAPIYAVAPRAGLGVTTGARKRLEELEVEYIEQVLNIECVEYGSANRVVAAAYVEAYCRHDILVVLDSDTLFVREPVAFELSAGVHAAVRPVDVKGMCTTGLDDVRDAYWQTLCRICNVSYDDLPFTTSYVDGIQVKSSYNGGLVVVRTELGMMQRWADFFLRSVRARLIPHTQMSLRAGAGHVAPSSGRWWGSNQAALSLALWSTTRGVVELSPQYNYPLHMHCEIKRDFQFPLEQLVHVHYHWLFDADCLLQNPLHESGLLPPRLEAILKRRTPFPPPGESHA